MKSLWIDESEKLRFLGPGPWIAEPDEVYWVYKGVKCEIKRNSGGALCGYCAITKDHPWFGLDYDNDSVDVEVHGGLTWSHGNEYEWWFGFDCAHSGDLVPMVDRQKKAYETNLHSSLFKYKKRMSEDFPNCKLWNDTYRNIEFVRNECQSLADQLLAVGEK